MSENCAPGERLSCFVTYKTIWQKVQVLKGSREERKANDIKFHISIFKKRKLRKLYCNQLITSAEKEGMNGSNNAAST